MLWLAVNVEVEFVTFTVNMEVQVVLRQVLVREFIVHLKTKLCGHTQFAKVKSNIKLVLETSRLYKRVKYNISKKSRGNLV